MVPGVIELIISSAEYVTGYNMWLASAQTFRRRKLGLETQLSGRALAEHLRHPKVIPQYHKRRKLEWNSLCISFFCWWLLNY